MNEAELIAVGGDAALTFVNSAAPGRKPMELISDGPAYLAFLEQAGMLDAADRDAVARQFDRAELDAAATEATRLRSGCGRSSRPGPAHPSRPRPTYPSRPWPQRTSSGSTRSWPSTTATRCSTPIRRPASCGSPSGAAGGIPGNC